MNLLLIKALDDAHLYSVQTLALCNALREAGVSVDVFDVSRRPDGFVAALVAKPYEGVISFSSMLGALSLDDGRSIYDAVGTRFLGWHFDHPVYVQHHIANPMAGRRAIYPSESHLRFNAEAMMQSPSKVMLAGGTPTQGPPIDYGKRSMEVFVAATWNGEPVRSWEALGDTAATRLMAEVADRLMHDPARSLIDAFHAARDDMGLGGLELSREVIDLLRVVFSYVRDQDRISLVRHLVRSDLPVTLCGGGWREYLGDRAGLSYRPASPFGGIADLYGDAKIALNLNAANGASERAINAALCGACVVTEPAPALAAAFAEGREIAVFDPSTSPVGVIGDLLESGRGETMAQAGRNRALETGLWRHRVDDMLSLLR